MIATDTHDNLLEFIERFHLTRDRYLRYALRFVHNQHVAEDLVNESFANLWEKRHDLAADTIYERYFYTVIKNICLNWLQSQELHCRIQNRIYDSSYRLLQYDIAMLESYDPNLIFQDEIRAILYEQLEKMPELSRRIFLDSRFGDLTHEQIARKYAVSVWKVAREISSVIKILRISLQDYLPAYLIALICSSEMKFFD